ncbi:MAG TPA: hypothetical protein VNQ53_07855 [Nocardioides sp.]|nr:hypothetical protein [Nocardioides sp.]
MMTSTGWHVGPKLWARYAAGGLDYVTESAVDAHVVGCAECRQAARSYVDPAPLEQVWAAVGTETARPRLPFVLRGLVRIGLPERHAVVLGGSSGLHRPWVVAVASALLCALLSGFLPEYQDRFFVLLAPLVPVLAVAAAYDATDPMRELFTTTAHSKLGIALLRTAAALSAAVPLTTVVGLLVPGLESLAFAWLVPGLCLTVTMLVLLTWWDAATTTGVVATGWACAVGITGRDASALIDTARMQGIFVAVTLAMACLLVLRTASTRLRGGF